MAAHQQQPTGQRHNTVRTITVEEYGNIGGIYLFNGKNRELSLRLDGKGYDARSKRIKRAARKLLEAARST
jgi:hypothetical protein